MSILNNEEEMRALGIKPENLPNGQKPLNKANLARISSRVADPIHIIESKNTLIDQTNSELYTSLNDTYAQLKNIYKNFDKAYLLAPTSNSERKKKYATLQTLQKQFNDEYEHITSILPYTGDDKTIHARIAEIRRYYEMTRNDIALKTRIINANMAKPVVVPELLLPEQSRTAATPAPAPAPPPAPLISTTQMPSKTDINAKTEEFRRKAEQYRALIKRLKMNNTRKNNNTNALNNGRLASLYPNMNSFEAEEQNATPSASAAAPAPVPAPPPPPGAPPRQWPPPGPIRLPGRNTRKNAPLPKRQLKVVPPPPLPQVSSTLQTQNTRKNRNVFNNLANNRQRARELIRTSILGKQPVMTKMYQNTRRNALEEQPAQYIKLADGTTYKFIETIGDKVRAQKLDRITKTWEPAVELTEEQVNSSRVVDCPSSPQAGGRRTIRRRIIKRKKHRTLRRKSGR